MDNNTILNHLLNIILFFYSNSALPRNVVDNIISLFKCFLIKVMFPQLKADLRNACGDEFTNKINEVFCPNERIFDKVSSEKKFFTFVA